MSPLTVSPDQRPDHGRPTGIAATAAGRHENRLMLAGRPAAWALYALAPKLGAVVRLPRLGWVVSDPGLARLVLADNRNFSVFEEGGAGHLWRQVLGPEAEQMLTDAGHREVREKTRDLFTEQNSAALVDRTFGPTTARMLDRLEAGETVDVAAVTRTLVGRMAADLVGLDLARSQAFAPRPGADPLHPEDDSYHQVFEAVREFTTLGIRTLASTRQAPELIERSRVLVDRLAVGMGQAYRQAPEDSVLGLCRAGGLGFGEARSLALMMLVAATETGAASMTRAAALLHDTGQQHLLRVAATGAPDGRVPADLLAAAVRETLRVTSTAPVIGRHVSADVDLGGRRLRGGDRVLLLIHTANGSFGGFDLTRPAAPTPMHLWFGGGRHICLGAPLARAEIGYFIEKLVGLNRPWQVVRRGYGRTVLTPAYSGLTVRAV